MSAPQQPPQVPADPAVQQAQPPAAPPLPNGGQTVPTTPPGGQTPPYGYAPATGWAPPAGPPPSGGNAVKIAIIVAGAVVALVLIVAVIGFAGGRDAETTTTGGGGGGGGTTTTEGGGGGTTTTTEGGGGETIPGSGSLAGLIPEEVEGFTRSELEEYPEAIENGAVEAYKTIFNGPDGAAHHTVEAFGDDESALELHQGLVASLTEDGSHEVTEEAELDTGGTVTALASTEDADWRIVVWNNGPIFATTHGVGNSPIDLYNALPY
jgi:hypothetical protein